MQMEKTLPRPLNPESHTEKFKSLVMGLVRFQVLVVHYKDPVPSTTLGRWMCKSRMIEDDSGRCCQRTPRLHEGFESRTLRGHQNYLYPPLTPIPSDTQDLRQRTTQHIFRWCGHVAIPPSFCHWHSTQQNLFLVLELLRSSL